MHTPGSTWTVERRQHTDRRTRPTPFRSTLKLRRRRKGFRRVGEGHHAYYVDYPVPRVGLLALLVFGLSLLDAELTLQHLHDGGRELNPLIALVLTHSITAFVWIKTGVTGLGTWLLAAHQHFPVTYIGLHGLVLVYGLLLVYHLVLVVGHL